MYRRFWVWGRSGSSKRALMGEAGSSADLLVVTSDNPRWEQPAVIIEAIIQGVPRDVQCHVEVDREKAIGYALSQAEVGDVVLIAGKGHEQYQEIEESVVHYSDHDCVAGWYEGETNDFFISSGLCPTERR